ncbi:GTP cyclohydrolase II [Candidatus Gracilibacteria bacterium]|nr:GTP cyclohydrolase II [Candidatus Gracilibacteria bacterium]
MTKLDKVLADLRAGKIIVLVDDPTRENEADLVCAAQTITAESINFMAKFGRGLICAPISKQRADDLALTLMDKRNSGRLQQCNFTVSVDASNGISTGISAYDRAQTVKVLVDKKSKPSDLSTPGHIFPLIANDGGVLVRAGHTEGTIDLLKMAGMQPAGVLCEIMGDDGKMVEGKALHAFARKHKLSIYSISELIAHRKANESPINEVVEANLPTRFGKAKAYAFTTAQDHKEHMAVVYGKLTATSVPLVRIHSECLTGDVFNSERCDCNAQLYDALEKMKGIDAGIIIYLRNEGRGIGLLNKLRAYQLQDKGRDTVQANLDLGFKADEREFTVAAHLLKRLGVAKIRLITNNPQKIKEMEQSGISVQERVPSLPYSGTLAGKYLKTKQKKMGHLLP